MFFRSEEGIKTINGRCLELGGTKIISTEKENKVNQGSEAKIHEKERGKCKRDNRE
jgi:hypothetical protein